MNVPSDSRDEQSPDPLTGRDYVISAVKRQYTDRVPVTVLIGPYCSRLSPYTVREILRDPRKSAEAHMAFYERFRPDSLIVYNDVYVEAEALGCELVFPEDNVSHPKSSPLEKKSDLARLRVPDPKKDGRLPGFLELCERVSAKVRKTATIGLGHSGPWNLAMHLRGIEELLDDCIEDSPFVHEIMTFTTEVVREVGEALVDTGFSPSIAEACASCSLISPTIYRDFIKPYHKALRDHFRSKKIPMALHICGYIDPMMEDVLETGIDLISLDAPSSLQKIKELAGGRLVIMGNVQTSLFASGTEQEMQEAVRQCVETAAEGSGYILASGCEIPLDSTEDRIELFFDYGRRFGRRFMSELANRLPESSP